MELKTKTPDAIAINLTISKNMLFYYRYMPFYGSN